MVNKLFSNYSAKMRICDSVTTDNGIKIPCITGQVGVTDDCGHNGYRYKSDFWTTVLNNEVVQDCINSRRMLGTIEHPIEDDEFLSTSYENASHVVMKAWVQDSQPFATFGLLNNPKGNSIKALLDVGCNPGVSTRGMGSFVTDSVSQYVDPVGYQLITWDIVKNPNYSQLAMSPVTDSLRANPKFQELVQMYGLRDSADDHYSREKLISDAAKLVNELQGILLRIK